VPYTVPNRNSIIIGELNEDNDDDHEDEHDDDE